MEYVVFVVDGVGRHHLVLEVKQKECDVGYAEMAAGSGIELASFVVQLIHDATDQIYLHLHHHRRLFPCH